MFVDTCKNFTVKTMPYDGAHAKPVVRQLREIYNKIAITEANIELLAKMTKDAIATNDVRNFVWKQSCMRRVRNGLDKKTIKKLMKQKLDDACSFATRLKQRRQKLRRDAMKSMKPVRAVKRLIGDCEIEFKNTKTMQRMKNNKKLESLTRKQDMLEIGDNVPEGVVEFVKGVNVFKTELEVEEAIGPMICCKDIEIDENERKFLEKGPRFMLRGEIEENDFRVEMEKMIAKESFTSMDESDDEGGGEERSNSGEDEVEKERVNKAVKEEEARGRMTYDRVKKDLDLGNLKTQECN